MNITKSDYKEILKYYGEKVEEKEKIKSLRERVERKIAEKLCSCIKKVDNSKSKDESRPIAICTNHIVLKKNLKIEKFKCKKGAKLTGKKKLIKTNKTIKLGKGYFK